MRAAATVLALVGAASVATATEGWTTIQPCPNCPPSKFPSITVTSQYQPIITCEPLTSCLKGHCETSYPVSTWTYLSTVLPWNYNGTITKTTVTEISATITVSKIWETETSYSPVPTTFYKTWGNYTKEFVTTTSTAYYKTIEKDYCIPYASAGPLAYPGWEGSGLCTDCGEDEEGVRYQPVEVIECGAWGNAHPTCFAYTQTYISSPAPTATVTPTATFSSHYWAPSAGPYTFEFWHTPPWQTVSAPVTAAETIYYRTWTFEPQPWSWSWTTECSGPTSLDFTTTIVTTVYITVPCTLGGATTTYPATAPGGWGTWTNPGGPGYTGGNPWSTYPGWGNPGTYTMTVTTSLPGHTWTITQTDGNSGSYTTTTTTESGPVITVTTTTTASAPTGTPFNVQVLASGGGKWHKRALDYIGFSGDDGIVVTDSSAAAIFYLTDQQLISSGDFVGTDSNSGVFPFEKFYVAPEYSQGWSVSGGVVSFLDATFCFSSDNSVFILLGGVTAPFTCVSVDLYSVPVGGSKTSSGSSSTWSSTSHKPSNSDYPDEDIVRREIAAEIEAAREPQFKRALSNKRVARRAGVLQA